MQPWLCTHDVSVLLIVIFAVKPSNPFCKIEGMPEKGHLISLLCKCDEGFPHPTYHWYRVDENTLKPVTEQFSMYLQDYHTVPKIWNVSVAAISSTMGVARVVKTSSSFDGQ